METLLDYVKWMGSFGFDSVPLQDADVLILCVISYFDLTPVFSGEKKQVKVSDCAKMAEEGTARLLITGGDMGNFDVFNAAVHSRRFGDLLMTDCVDILEEEPPLQFAAVTFHDPGRFSLIAYRGTDSSLAGWKENFMISFTQTKAQEMAAGYAHRMISAACDLTAADDPDAGDTNAFVDTDTADCNTTTDAAADPAGTGDSHKWYIAGHSKGGNLALYAGCMLTDEELDATERIYSLDGPGMCPEVIDIALIQRVDHKTSFIIPEFDVVGRLFEPAITDTRIVRSYRDGIAQHSLPSWLIDHGGLALANKNAPGSLRLNQVIDEWIEDKSFDVRQTFIDELFGALSENGITDFEDMTLENLFDTLSSLKGISQTTKETLEDLGHKAIFGENSGVPTLGQVQQQVQAQVQIAQQDERTGFIPSLKKKAAELIQKPFLLQGILLLPLGVLVAVAYGHLLDLICLVLVFAITGVEFYVTTRRLIRSKWNFREHRENIYICIIMLSLITSLYVKENATFLFGSMIAGALLLIAAYHAGEKAAAYSNDRFARFLCIAESVLSAVYGLSFVIISHEAMEYYSLSLGILMVIDGLLRVLHYRRKSRRGRVQTGF
ncbi:MAG: DUF2974 domain-containing protein [Lachnospiraceae bacterium]|nr:DUF2974 domain-containing protein [Lachnospiraceae bacterium]